MIFNTWPSELCYQDLIAKNTILLKLIANSFLSTDPIHYIGLSQSAGLFLQRSKGGSGIEVISQHFVYADFKIQVFICIQLLN